MSSLVFLGKIQGIAPDREPKNRIFSNRIFSVEPKNAAEKSSTVNSSAATEKRRAFFCSIFGRCVHNKFGSVRTEKRRAFFGSAFRLAFSQRNTFPPSFFRSGVFRFGVSVGVFTINSVRRVAFFGRAFFGAIFPLYWESIFSLGRVFPLHCGTRVRSFQYLSLLYTYFLPNRLVNQSIKYCPNSHLKTITFFSLQGSFFGFTLLNNIFWFCDICGVDFCGSTIAVRLLRRRHLRLCHLRLRHLRRRQMRRYKFAESPILVK